MSATIMMTATVVADDSVGSEAGLAARAEGVTASEIHAIATGGPGTSWKTTLENKLNGSTFGGNVHTRRGHAREAAILADVAAMPAVETLTPNRALFAHAKHQLHRATPDGLLVQVDGVAAGVEVKSRKYSWDATKIPAEVVDQCQWGMHVTGLDLWYQVTEVTDPDGHPTLDDPTVALIVRDERRIRQLVKAADEFLTWREAGAPDDTLPDDELDAVGRWNAAKARISAATEEAKALEKQVRKIIAARPGSDVDGWKFHNSRIGGFTYSVTTAEVTTLDETAWKVADPAGYDYLVAKRAEVDDLMERARKTYSKIETKTSTRLLPVAPKGTTR